MKLSEFGRLGAVRSWLVVSASVFVLAACGGGDGPAAAPPPAASPPPPPPPPVSTNTAPVATILTDNATPDEGQPFMVDASSSTDPDNDNLTFMWTQTAGPDLEIADPTSPTQSFTAPELTETVTVTFEVEVSDGELINTASVDVQLTNIFQMPRAAEEFVEVASLATSGPSNVLKTRGRFELLIQNAADGTAVLQGLDVDEDLDALDLLTDIEPLELSPNSIVQAFTFVHFGFVPAIAIVDELVGTVSYFDGSTTGAVIETYRQIGSFNVDNVCGLDFGNSLIGTRESGLISFLSGAENGGLPPNPSDPPTFNPDGFVAVTTSGSPCIIGDADFTLNNETIPNGLDGTLAVDPDALTVSLFRSEFDVGLARDVFELVETSPLDTLQQTDLNVLGFLVLDNLFTVGRFGERGVVLLLSDGQHDGTHLINFISIALDGSIEQAVYSWDKGVPADIIVSEISADESPRVIITSSTSTELTIFASEAVVDAQDTDFTSLVGPFFAEVGLGAGSVQIATGSVPTGPFGNFSRTVDVGFVASFPEENEVRFFELQ